MTVKLRMEMKMFVIHARVRLDVATRMYILFLFVCYLRMSQLRTELHTHLRFPVRLSRHSFLRNESSVMA
jgi:hypothetical protein